jgi:hypothetical protein
MRYTVEPITRSGIVVFLVHDTERRFVLKSDMGLRTANILAGIMNSPGHAITIQGGRVLFKDRLEA